MNGEGGRDLYPGADMKIKVNVFYIAVGGALSNSVVHVRWISALA